MTDKELLIVSIIGIFVFIVITRYVRAKVSGMANEARIKKYLRTITIIYVIVMTVQIFSLVSRLLSD